jgi:hypothetical protein
MRGDTELKKTHFTTDLMSVLTLAACTSYNFFTASLIWRLLDLISTMKTSVLCSSIFFIADSVFKGLGQRQINERQAQRWDQHLRYNSLELVHSRGMGDWFPRILGLTGKSESFWAMERDRVTLFPCGMWICTFQHSFFGSLCLGLFRAGFRYRECKLITQTSGMIDIPRAPAAFTLVVFVEVIGEMSIQNVSMCSANELL